MPRYRYVIEEDAATALFALADTEVRQLVAAIEALASDPSAKPDSHRLDRQGNVLANAITGNFQIAYWADHPNQRLYILKIDLLAPG